MADLPIDSTWSSIGELNHYNPLLNYQLSKEIYSTACRCHMHLEIHRDSELDRMGFVYKLYNGGLFICLLWKTYLLVCYNIFFQDT